MRSGSGAFAAALQVYDDDGDDEQVGVTVRQTQAQGSQAPNASHEQGACQSRDGTAVDIGTPRGAMPHPDRLSALCMLGFRCTSSAAPN